MYGIRTRLFGAAFFMTLISGYTNCTHFRDVRVPVTPTNSISVLSAFFEAGTFTNVTTNLNTTSNNVAVPYDKAQLVTVAVIDNDGPTALRTRWTERIQCCRPILDTGIRACDPPLEERYFGDQTQEGVRTGAIVKNGIYDYREFNPRPALEAKCGWFAYTSNYFLGWEVVGVSFKGDFGHHAGGAHYNSIPPQAE